MRQTVVRATQGAALMLAIAACNDSRDVRLTATTPHPIPSIVAPEGLVVSNPNAALGAVVTVTAYAAEAMADGAGSFMARLSFDTVGLTYIGPVEQTEAGTAHAMNVVHGQLRVAGASANGFDRRALFAAKFRVNTSNGLQSLALMPPRTDVIPPSGANVIGDASANGVLEASDAQLILMDAAGLAVPAPYSAVQADASMDGSVTAFDAQIVLSYLVDLDIANFRVGDDINATPITITSVSPAVLIPGGTVTISGTNFATLSADSVFLDSVMVPVISATPTQLTVQLPNAMTCRPLHDGILHVRSAGAGRRTTAPVQAGTRRTLQVGESIILHGSAETACNELSQTTGASYVVTVFNAAQVAFAPTLAFIKITGDAVYAPPGAAGAIAPPARATLAGPPHRTFAQSINLLPPKLAKRMAMLRRHEAAHAKFMRQQRMLVEGLLRRGVRPLRQANGARSASALRAPRGAAGQIYAPVSEILGAMSSIKIPTETFDTFTTVRARTAYVGQHCIILEDSTAALAGTIDASYKKLADEFDQTIFPMLTANFGNPLAMDANLDANGRIIMLFTPVLKAQFPGLAGFVTTCDFFDDSDCGPSNKAEIFYATTPTVAGSGYGPGTVSDWLWEVRAVIAHESKHITSNAERLSRSFNGGGVWEESWLEEGTAQIAAELYGRAIYGASKSSWKGNATYQNTVYCDLRPEWPECLDHPLVMLDHFSWLYDFGQFPASHSILNDSDDGTIYGSAWSFARWLADTYASNEGSFFKALTQASTLSGVDNVEAQTGVPWSQLLGKWSLALAADDQVQGGPNIASWNLPDIYSGMASDIVDANQNHIFIDPPLFKSPIKGRAFDDDRTLLGGGVLFYQASLLAYQSQTIGIRARDNTPLPPNSRVGMAILRTN